MDVMETGGLQANIMANTFVNERAQDVEDVEETKSSSKKKSSTNEDNGSDFDEVDEVDDVDQSDENVEVSDGSDGGNDERQEDFRLRDLFFPCQLLQAQFELPISCRVDIFESLESDGSVGAVVEVNDPVCSPALLNRNACVNPIYSAYFGLTDLAISSRVDFTNITVGEFELGDIGLELEACGLGSGLTNVFCNCEASYNGQACNSCQICGLGNGNPINAVEFDCTNLVPFLSNFNSCEEINVLQALKTGNIQVSVPNFIKELQFR